MRRSCNVSPGCETAAVWSPVLAARGEASETEIRSTLRRTGEAARALAEEAAALADPHLDGPAHGMVAVLSTDEVYRFTMPRPVETLITFASRPDVVPIARAHDAARLKGAIIRLRAQAAVRS